MIKTTTYSDLLTYAYNENDLLDSDRIQRSIDGDPAVQNEFNELVELLNSMETAPPVPDKCIEKILQFC